MAGFGSGPFGTGGFGRAQVVYALGFGQMPSQMQFEDDSGDLERERTMFAELLFDRYAKIEEHAQLRAPISTPSFIELAQVVPIVTASILNQDLSLELSPAQDALLWQMFASTQDPTSSSGVLDGWSAVIDDVVYPVIAVDAFERTISIRTDKLPSDLGPTVELRPPDLLTLHSGWAGIFVDRRDVPDYTRRALYRTRLIRDWKVTDQVFRLIGRIYGFDVQVTPLWCISPARAAQLLLTSPANVFQFNAKFYTDLAYRGHRYDATPADVLPMDLDQDFTVAVVASNIVEVDPVTLLPAANTGWWQIDVGSAVTDLISVDAQLRPLGRVIFEDAQGVRYWIERVEQPSSGVIYVTSLIAPAAGAGQVIFEVDFLCAADYRRAALYNIDITPTEVLIEPGSDLTRLIERMEEKVAAYVPIHIRVGRRRIVISGIAAVPLFNGATFSSILSTTDQNQTAPPFTTALYDAIAADAQAMDAGLLVPSGSLTYNP
jgi:hypothetical protein